VVQEKPGRAFIKPYVGLPVITAAKNPIFYKKISASFKHGQYPHIRFLGYLPPTGLVGKKIRLVINMTRSAASCNKAYGNSDGDPIFLNSNLY